MIAIKLLTIAMFGFIICMTYCGYKTVTNKASKEEFVWWLWWCVFSILSYIAIEEIELMTKQLDK